MAAGRDPTLGPYSILGDNDFPYEDRCVVCVRRGRTYKPMRVRDAVSPRYAVEVPDQVSTGYRAISRDSIVLSEDATAHWTNACSMLAVTITNLAKSCTLLGYDVLTDRLNVAREDDTVWQIADSLLVLIIPVSDNALFGRFVIPSSNGSACILRLEGAYVTPTMAEAWIWGIDRHIVEQSMREWLGAHKGSWRHGWLHNSDTGSIWYEDMFNSKQNSLGFLSSRFEGWTGTEMDCTTRPSVCKHLATDCRWGDTLHTPEQLEYLQLILAGDGTGEGLFQLNFIKTLKIWNVYTLALLVSNASVMIILSHWLIAICALHRNYRHQHEAVPTVSIGVLSNNKGFVLLPLVLLPRLRVALAAFFTVGCAFEGEQLTLSEAWFVIYPGIAQVLLFTFSAFNLAVKVCRRRMSDALFGPMLIFFCSLHLLKQPLANSTWLGYDGRIPTVISSSEYETLTLLDFFTTDVALRMNGNVKVLFWLKLVALVLNIVPYVFSQSTSGGHVSDRDRAANKAEQMLEIRPWLSGGLGHSVRCSHARISAYELVRHGYIVLNDLVLVSISDWPLIVISKALGRFSSVLSLRVLVMPLETRQKSMHVSGGEDTVVWCVDLGPLFVSASALGSRVWNLSAMDFQ